MIPSFFPSGVSSSTPTQTPDAKSTVPQYLEFHKKLSVFFLNQVKQELHCYLSVAPLALSTNILSPTLSHMVLSMALPATLSAAFL